MRRALRSRSSSTVWERDLAQTKASFPQSRHFRPGKPRSVREIFSPRGPMTSMSNRRPADRCSSSRKRTSFTFFSGASTEKKASFPVGTSWTCFSSTGRRKAESCSSMSRTPS